MSPEIVIALVSLLSAVALSALTIYQAAYIAKRARRPTEEDSSDRGTSTSSKFLAQSFVNPLILTRCGRPGAGGQGCTPSNAHEESLYGLPSRLNRSYGRLRRQPRRCDGRAPTGATPPSRGILRDPQVRADLDSLPGCIASRRQPVRP